MRTKEAHTAVTAKQQRRRTAAAERATGQFHCSSSNHFTTGEYELLRGRKICADCSAKRRNLLRAARAARSADRHASDATQRPTQGAHQ